MLDRSVFINVVKNTIQFDAIVIGGGATGLGIAFDMSSRGLKVLLIEEYDFAKGTSSRSTKLLHGGVRYLANFDFSLVKKALKEKEILLKNAPHIANNQSFVIPCYSLFDVGLYRMGMLVYDFLAGFPSNSKSSMISAKEVISMYPSVKEDNLVGGVVYNDGVFDDARMAISLVKSIVNQGSLAINYSKLTELIKNEDGKIIGIEFLDKETNDKIKVYSPCVVNATGIFVDNICELDDYGHKKLVKQAQGVHLVFDKEKIPSNFAMLIPKTEDGRVLFTVPWNGKVIVGTTDTKVDVSEIEPIAFDFEVKFILDNINKYLKIKLTTTDVLSVYAGIRPLINQEGINTAKTSREEKIVISKSNLVSVVGGKWTSFRKMGATIVDFLVKQNLVKKYEMVSDKTKIYGYLEKNALDKIPDCFKVYGSEYEKLKLENGFDRQIHSDLPFVEAQIRYAIKYEMARNLDDIMARRIRILFLDAKAAIESVNFVAEILQQELLISDTEKYKQIKDFVEIADNYLII
jgi:glycerol-3-phosphate dehydrogenase